MTISLEERVRAALAPFTPPGTTRLHAARAVIAAMEEHERAGGITQRRRVWMDETGQFSVLEPDLPDPVEAMRAVDDKSHPRFIAGYDAGMNDRRLEAVEAAEAMRAKCEAIARAEEEADNLFAAARIRRAIAALAPSEYQPEDNKQ